MKAKNRGKKNQKKRNARNQRETTRKIEKAWRPSNYLLEPHPELGIPECESVARGYASPM